MLSAQELPLHHNYSARYLGGLYQSDSLVAYSVKPLVPKFHNFEHEGALGRPYRSYVARKLFFEHFIVIDTSDFYVTIDPLFSLEAGSDLQARENEVLIQNTRGFQVRGAWKDKLTFSTSFYENQAEYPDYLGRFVVSTGVVPGQGRVKSFKDGGYDFAMASARINYIPNEHLMISLGQDKNFIGEGYRSILLSDNAFNYPFISAQLNFLNRKFTYLTMIAGLQDLDRVGGSSQTERIFNRKTASIHYLEYSPIPALRVGLFESTVLPDALARQEDGPRDNANYSFINPVIGLNTLINGKNDSLVNSTLGLNASFRPLKTMLVYGQLSFRDLDLKNSSAQLGGVFSGIKNMLWRLEWNNSGRNSNGLFYQAAAQSHYGQYLGHNYGQRFNEILMRIDYSKNRISAEFGANYVRYDIDNLGPFFNFDQAFPWLQNDELILANARIGFIVNPATNMQLSIGAIERFGKIKAEPEDLTSNTRYLYISFQTALINRYRDF